MKIGNRIRILNIDILSLTQEELLYKLDEGVLYAPHNHDHLINSSAIENFTIFISGQNGSVR